MQLDKRCALVMTSGGQFLKLKVRRNMPAVGEVYTGELVKATPFYKYAAAAASLAFVLFSGTATYAYYTPTSSVVVDINPSIELKLNRWNRIIKALPLNSDGEKVLSSLNIKHKSVNDGLDSIVEEAKKDNFINDNYIQSGRIIKISIESNDDDKKLNLSEFNEYAKKNNLKVDIIKKKEDKKAAPKEPENAKPSNPSNTPDKHQNDKNDKSDNGNDKTTNPVNNNVSPSSSNKNNETKSRGLIFNSFKEFNFNIKRESNNKQSSDKDKNKADNKDNDNKEKNNSNDKK